MVGAVGLVGDLAQGGGQGGWGQGEAVDFGGGDAAGFGHGGGEVFVFCAQDTLDGDQDDGLGVQLVGFFHGVGGFGLAVGDDVFEELDQSGDVLLVGGGE